MKKLLLAIIVTIIVLSPVYSASTNSWGSGFAITYGETTYNNPSYKNSVVNYFESHTNRNLDEANTEVITAMEVNKVSKDITGRTYPSNQIFSCAMVDLSYTQGIKVVVDESKITVVTSKMYATALKSTGIESGYVVVTSPVSATGESALTGVMKSYEIAVGTPIPENAKKAATDELYTQSQIAEQTGQDPNKIADLFDQVKQEAQKQNLDDPAQIKEIVINIAATLNINLTNEQAQQIANAVANSQKAQDSLTDFKNRLESVTQQASESQGIINQIMNYLQGFIDYIMSFI
ncbi:MAG: DUF1002 domain-containing protein [Euryarchaeota archaeon]|jgi:uncharacterized protein YpuA (DUF1002 family)|uniref:DUF1002 domain-containing protein n=1 Tax=Methanobacterium sp. MZD130B TaxID=3394378 RepID=UPI001777430B|nr:DUF1002 domain-containing protein [Euryarchaeota archaeon]HHT19223.1 DUF1002 domain-containing protein [Methanobacterium sp.]